MPRYDFTRRAFADLHEIATSTKKAWGAERARLYREELELSIQKLALSPGTGRSREDVAPSAPLFSVARHVAFYVQCEEGITVLRLLHPSMDIGRWFSESEQ